MNTYPSEPSAGDRISATLIRDIIRCLRRITPVAGPGVKQRVTPNGTVIMTENVSTTSSSASRLPSCWDIEDVSTNPNNQNATKKPGFVNRYYAVGGNMKEYVQDPKVFIDYWVMQGELQEGEEYTQADKPFVFIEVYMEKVGNVTPGTTVIGGVKTYEDLLELCGNTSLFVKPLYKLSHDGGVVVDFRNMPLVSSHEIPSQGEVTT